LIKSININSLFKALSITILLGVILHAPINAQQYTEYEVRAAYLFNFAKFVQWTEKSFKTPTTSFVIGIYGKNQFESILAKTLQGRTINNRNIIIKYYKSKKEIDCNILFVSELNKLELIELISYLKNKPILTVGDNIDEFCELGGMINFTKQHEKQRFEINNNAALRSKLIINSKLLSLAKIITDNEVEF